MGIDHSVIGGMAAELMEEADQRYGEGAKIRHAALLLAVKEGEEITYHYSFRPEAYPHEQLGLLEQISRHIGGRTTGS